MKKILSLVIILGFVLMIGAAGGADLSGTGLFTAFLLEILGMAMIFFGTSALMHYKRYIRKMVRAKRIASKKTSATPVPVRQVLVREKEFC